MEIRDFGKTGLKVSVLGFGASHVGRGDVSEDDASRTLNAVLDAGVTLIDTARGYGSSEERVGRHIAHRRDEFVLSSKCGYSIEGTQDWTYDCVAKGIDRALSLMKTDRIDIMHLHSCPEETLFKGEVTAALLHAKDAGKIRVVAYSGENAPRRHAIECGFFGSIQASVNICDQRIIDESFPPMIDRGLGMIAKRPVANAFWRFADRPHGDYSEVYWDRAKVMGLTPGKLPWLEYALRFTAFTPGVHSCIVGTSRIAHFEENLKAVAKGPLPEDVIRATREAFKKHGAAWDGQV